MSKSLSIKKGDQVVVLWGKDKDRRGKILKVLPDEKKCVVEGINIAKRHSKPSQKIRQGGILDKPLPLPICKVMVICPKCNKPTRTTKGIEENKKVRRCKKCGETIDKQQ